MGQDGHTLIISKQESSIISLRYVGKTLLLLNTMKKLSYLNISKVKACSPVVVNLQQIKTLTYILFRKAQSHNQTHLSL